MPPHNSEIVTDEQIGQIMPSLEVAQEFNDLELHGYIQG
jgi:hypothetical protein